MPMPTTPETTVDIPGEGGLCRIDVGWVFLPEGRQRVRVAMDGQVLGEAAVTAPCALEFIAPRGGAATLTLLDAKSPMELGLNQDPRQLSIGIASVVSEPATEAFAGVRLVGRETDRLIAATGLSASELAMRFMSLGMQCEFGLVQRQMGAEPLGLLRFANTMPEALIHLLRERFRGLGTPGTLDVRTFGPEQEFIVTDRLYGFEYHTWQYASATTPEALMEREATRLPFLARHLVETLEDAETILVFKDAVGTVTDGDVSKLHEALRAYGRNRLLMTRSVVDDRAGQVIDLGNGLWHGFIGYNGPDYWQITTDWMPVLTRVYREASVA